MIIADMQKQFGGLVGNDGLSLIDPKYTEKLADVKPIQGIDQIMTKSIIAPANTPFDDFTIDNISNNNPIITRSLNYDTIVTVLTNIEERKTVVENIAFSEVRTAVQRYVRNYIYFPQIDGYLRFSFHRASRALKDNMLSILEHTLTELNSFRFIISVDSIFVQYDPEVGVITDIEIVKNSAPPQVVLPSNRSRQAIDKMINDSMEKLYTMFENNKLKATDYTFFCVDNITLNILNFVPKMVNHISRCMAH